MVPLHLDEAFANSKLLERLGRQDERWTVVVPRGWRTQDEMTLSQSGSQWAGYDSALADQANSARLCSSGGQEGKAPRWSTWCGCSSCLHLVDAVWAWLAQAVKSAMMMKIPCVPVVEPCEADQWWVGSVHPPALDRQVLEGTDRYIGLQNGAEPEAVS